jgi:hypothetical protein
MGPHPLREVVLFLMEEGMMSLVTVSLFTTWMTLLLMDVRWMGLVHLLLVAALWLLFRRKPGPKPIAGSLTH